MGQGVQLGIVSGVFQGWQVVSGVFRVCFLSETAQVELNSGRV